MTLLEPIDITPFAAAIPGFVPREFEDDVARHLLRPLFPAHRESVAIAGFDAFARLAGLEYAAGASSGRCVIPPHCWNGMLGRRIVTVVIAHNHPSGVARPSDADRVCTREAAHFLQLLGIDLTDHLIFVESGHFSFRHAQLI